ncbi:MAG: DUF6398 domain-containing protein [Sedimentisphaerales bacterium]
MAEDKCKAAQMRIPKKNRQLFEQIIELIDAFCDAHLNKDYKELCEEVALFLYASDLAGTREKTAGWASGIVHAIGWVNCLYDPTMSPHINSREIAKEFGVSQGTMLAKSKMVRKGLGLVPLDPDWCISIEPEDNPMVWMVEVNGFIMDIRYAPREVQEEAYRLGLIPFIPADKREPEPESGTGAKIIEFPSKRSETSKPNSHQSPKDDGPSLFEDLEEQGISDAK